jgi:hypothetical protein
MEANTNTNLEINKLTLANLLNGAKTGKDKVLFVKQQKQIGWILNQWLKTLVVTAQIQRKLFGVTTKLTMMQYSKPYSFEKTECVGKKIKNIAPNGCV